ncbi:MAG: radical SAM protein [Planctomycetaceae bacterium]|jgi:organic radical activating enzyme|nr:radical SAM protein [Planctomycetaceae bacterium]
MKLSEFSFFKPINKYYRYVFPKAKPHVTFHKRVWLASISFFVANCCNLKCDYCCHFNQFRKGIIQLSELKIWFNDWSTVIDPQSVILVGGEPLINPEIAEIAAAVRYFWRRTKIRILTNGRLIPKINTEKLRQLKRIKVVFDISPHGVNEELKNNIEKILNNYGIKFKWNLSDQSWQELYHIENGQPIPLQCNPTEAYKICNRKDCIAINDNKLFKCSYLANINAAYNEGILPDNWKKAAQTKTLTPNATATEIVNFLRNGAIPECAICPDTK